MIWQMIRQDKYELEDAIQRGIAIHRERQGTVADTVLCHHSRVSEFRAATTLAVRGSAGVQRHEFLVGREAA